ncbi:MAG: hypothetical protein HUJ31_15950, partial [Pseudomonadales bacterium]|nr:hypothetical protein [Pseudomonadales bacterium]
MNKAFNELMQVRGLGQPDEQIEVTGKDPALSTRFKLGETSAAVQAAIGVALNDLWELNTCLLSTSDAAAEEEVVDVGRTRVIKKK